MKKYIPLVLIAVLGCSPENPEGKNGKNSLVDITDELPSTNCANGGLRIATGIDQNENTILDVTEVTSTRFVCYTVNTLVTSVAEPPGPNCMAGGIKIQTGSDKNGNGLLEVREVQQNVYACNGTSYLVNTEDESAGTNCVYGGFRIISGMDKNDNAILDQDEILQTKFICNPDPAAPLRITAPADNAIINESTEILFTLDQSLKIVRYEYYIDYSLNSASEEQPTSLVFDNNSYPKGSAHTIYLSVLTKEGKRYNSNIIKLVTGILAKPTALAAQFPDEHSASLTWQNNSNVASGNKVYRSIDNGTFLLLGTVDPSVNIFVDDLIETTHEYAYKVEVFNNTESIASNVLTIRYDAGAYENVNEFSPFSDVVIGKIKISKSGEMIAVTRSHQATNLALINLSSSQVNTVDAHNDDGAFGASFSVDGQLLATGGYGDNSIEVRNASTRSLVHSFSAGLESGYALAFSDDNALLAVGGYLNPIMVYNTSDWSFLHSTTGHNVTRSVQFSHDKQLLSAGNDNVIKLWDAGGTLINTYTGHTGHVGEARFMPGETQIVSASYEDSRVKLWTTDSGTEADSYTNDSVINGLGVTKSGKVVIGGNNGTVKVLDPATLDVLDTFTFSSAVLSLDCSVDKDIVGVYLQNGKVIILQKTPQWRIVP